MRRISLMHPPVGAKYPAIAMFPKNTHFPDALPLRCHQESSFLEICPKCVGAGFKPAQARFVRKIIRLGMETIHFIQEKMYMDLKIGGILPWWD